MSAALAAKLFAGLTGVVMLFQLGLAAGMPWGAMSMGGAYPGVYPAPMRLAAFGLVPVLGIVAGVVLVRGGVILSRLKPRSRIPVFVVVALMAVGSVLNLITPSAIERMVWAPVSLLLFVTSLRVALSR